MSLRPGGLQKPHHWPGNLRLPHTSCEVTLWRGSETWLELTDPWTPPILGCPSSFFSNPPPRQPTFMNDEASCALPFGVDMHAVCGYEAGRFENLANDCRRCSES